MIDIASVIAGNFLALILALVISSFPFYFAVRLCREDVGFVKAISISILLSLALASATRFIGIVAGILMLAAILVLYKLAFKLSFMQAIMVWALQYILVFLAMIIVISIFAI